MNKNYTDFNKLNDYKKLWKKASKLLQSSPKRLRYFGDHGKLKAYLPPPPPTEKTNKPLNSANDWYRSENLKILMKNLTVSKLLH